MSIKFNLGESGGGGAGSSWESPCPEGEKFVEFNIQPFSEVQDIKPCGTCPEDYSLVGDMCVKCPEGFTLVNGLCFDIQINPNAIFCREDTPEDIPPPIPPEEDEEEEGELVCPECFFLVNIPTPITDFWENALGIEIPVLKKICLYNVFCNIPEINIPDLPEWDWPEWDPPDWDPPIPPELPPIPPPEDTELPDEICPPTCKNIKVGEHFLTENNSCRRQRSDGPNQHFYISKTFVYVPRNSFPGQQVNEITIGVGECDINSFTQVIGWTTGPIRIKGYSRATISCTGPREYSNTRAALQYRTVGSWLNVPGTYINPFPTTIDSFKADVENYNNSFNFKIYSRSGVDVYIEETDNVISEFGFWHIDYLYINFNLLGLGQFGSPGVALPNIGIGHNRGFLRVFGRWNDSFSIESINSGIITTSLIDLLSFLGNDNYLGSDFERRFPARSWSLKQNTTSGTIVSFIDIPSTAVFAKIQQAVFIPSLSSPSLPSPRNCII